MKYYLVAGERSGDMHGGNLIKALKSQDSQAVFRGIGGSEMKKAGAELLADYNELAVMGIVEVLASIFKIMKYLKLCRNDIAAFNPDVVILIDYAGFNMRIAKFAHNAGFKTFYYITPKIWAWNTSRVQKIKSYIDRAFVILPFEKDFFSKHGVKSDYVGNPVADAIRDFTADSNFLESYKLDPSKPLIALLPGSRKQEILTMLPEMLAFAKSRPALNFVVAGVSNQPVELYEECVSIPNVTLILEENYNILQVARAAIVTSGTATLETALFEVPQIIAYRTPSRLTYFIVKRLIKVPFIGLPNLIADRLVVKECIQDNAVAERYAEEIDRILANEEYRKSIIDGYAEIKTKIGYTYASKEAARLMDSYLAAH